MSRLVTTVYSLSFSYLPLEFDGFTIFQVSDLHNNKIYKRVLEKIEIENPDIIVITGDLIHVDCDYENALKFIEGAVKLKPVYYVNGNHEFVLNCYGEFKEKIIKLGVRVLENDTEILKRNQKNIAIMGISDPAFFKALEGGVKKDAFKAELKSMSAKNEGVFKVLLSHRPELKDAYFDANINLTLTGHAHGGQVRLPLIGAIYAPNQKFFPPLTRGAHREDENVMLISRGLGKSNFVPRFFNPPEIVIAELKAKK